MRSSVFFTNVAGRDDVVDALVARVPATDVDRRRSYSVWMHFDGMEPTEARNLVAATLRALHPDAPPDAYLF